MNDSNPSNKNQRQSVILVNQSSGYLTEDIANSFVNENYDVTILASSFNSKRLHPAVKHVSLPPYDRTSYFKRCKTLIKGYIQINKFLKNSSEKTNILFFSNPFFSYFAASKLKNKYAIVVFDIWPDPLTTVPCTKLIRSYWSKKNKKIFENATNIFTLTQGMKNSLKKYVSHEKIKVVQLWPLSNEVNYVPQEKNPFLLSNNLKDKFVVLFSGNMGKNQKLSSIIEVANKLSKFHDIKFIFIGDGHQKQYLQAKASSYNLSNVLFFPFLPLEEIKYSLSAADIGVVVVGDTGGNLSIPSKTFNLLSYGVPLLSIATENSEVKNIINTYDCGAHFRYNDINEMVNWILEVYNNKSLHKHLKTNALSASKDFTIKNADLFLSCFI